MRGAHQTPRLVAPAHTHTHTHTHTHMAGTQKHFVMTPLSPLNFKQLVKKKKLNPGPLKNGIVREKKGRKGGENEA